RIKKFKVGKFCFFIYNAFSKKPVGNICFAQTNRMEALHNQKFWLHSLRVQKISNARAKIKPQQRCSIRGFYFCDKAEDEQKNAHFLYHRSAGTSAKRFCKASRMLITTLCLTRKE